MKPEIHPNHNEISVICAQHVQTRPTMGEDLHRNLLGCHRFSPVNKPVDTAGRVDRFNKRYARGAVETAK
jgi:large subunit ribosomal protein L31